MKKIIALILATIMILALCACGGGRGATQLSGEGADAPLTKDDVIKMLIPSNASWPFREDWKIWEYMQEGSGATLDITSIPTSEMGTKLPIMFASRETLPDILAFTANKGYEPYAGEGLIGFEDLEAYMPVYNAWKNSLSEDEYSVVVKPRINMDGKIYYSPGTGREGKTRMYAWLYREDVFNKYGLKVPETFDELYDVCKELKEIYPDSYPFMVRGGLNYLDIASSSFDKWWEHRIYYDFDDKEWRWGATEETAREIVTFYNKMVSENLMPADFATMNNTMWEEHVLAEKGFIMPHLQLRIDFFNNAAKGKIPGFKIQAIVPPIANPEKGVRMVGRGDIEQFGLSICDTGNADAIANAAKFIDWMYTDEAMELVSWGKEGETYEIIDGKKKFITDENNSAPNALYGFQLYGTFTRLDPLAAEAVQSETTLESEAMVVEHTLPYYNPNSWLTFNDEEQDVIDEYYTALVSRTEEMFLKFILGQEPISNFDKFVEELNEMGVKEVIGAYESAYSRVK